MSFGSDGFNGKILISNPPPLHNGIIGGWACSGAFFQTYGANGVVNATPTNAEINSVGPATNLQITNTTLYSFGPPVLTADRTINTISMFENMNIDLAGHTLTLDSGGLAAETNSHVTVKNGTLTAGAGSGGELFLYGPVRVEAGIPSGSLTVSGNSASVTLAGNCAYTGPTTVNDGNVGIENAAALAPNNSVAVNGGTYGIYYTSATPAKLDHLALRQDGTIASSSTKIDANAYDVEWGKLYAPLSGSGSMTKTGDGEVILRTDNSAWSGNITISGGQLTLGDGSISSPFSLGTGTTTVLPGGRLVVHTGTVRGHIVLAGGTAEGIGDDFADGLTVTSTSALTAGTTTISGPLSVAPGASLVATTSSGTLNVTGNATINGALTANAGLQVTPGSGSSLTGSGSVGGVVTITGGGKLAPGNSPGALSASAVTFGPAGSYVWEVNDADGGAGSTWDLLNVDGTLTINATSGNRFVLKLASLTGSNLPGLAADFDPGRNYTWTIATADQISGFASQLFTIDASGFLNNLQGGHFSLSASQTTLSLQFTAVPEPSGLVVLGLALCGIVRQRRHR
jgi:autotransporter-associated beta strand protein